MSVRRFASFDSLISVIGLNSQAWRTAWKKAKRERRNGRGARVGAPHLRTHARKSRSDATRRKGSKKLRAVLGRSVKCLNKRAIILTRSGISGVFQPSKVSPSFSHLRRYLGPSGYPRVCLFSAFVFRVPAEDVVGRAPRKKHKTCISFADRVESQFPFISRRFRPATLSDAVSLFLSLFPYYFPFSIFISISLI